MSLNPDEIPEVDDDIPDIEDEPAPEDDAAVEVAPSGPPLHHLETICQGCRVRVRLNDMPIADRVADDPDQAEWYAPPVNLYLVGRDNVIEVAVEPLEEVEDPRDALEDAEIEIAVRFVGKGEAIAPGAAPSVIEVAVHEELRDRIRASRERQARIETEGLEEEEIFEIPQTFFLLFDNEGPDFSDELSDAEPFDDEEALRDLALRIRDLAVAGDAAGLVAEMEPKLEAFARAYEEPRDMFHDDLLEGLRGEFLPAGIQADFERHDVVLEPCCGGRIWGLFRPGRRPLLQTPPDDEGGTMQIDVFVAPRDGGALRIVR